MFKREDLEALLDAKRNKQSTSASSSEGFRASETTLFQCWDTALRITRM